MSNTYKSNTQKTLWQLLNGDKINIKIPMIQRDYAHGRESDDINEIRNKFLDKIFEMILDKDKSVDLDFVYGTISDDNTLTLLDGQQRLTTIWLIHWYIAAREGILGKIDGKIKDEIKDSLKRFSYNTRISARDFCNELVPSGTINDSFPNKLFVNEEKHSEEKLSDKIKNLSFYFSIWDYDPTIKAMLVVLDSIHDKYNDMLDKEKQRKPEIENLKLWEKLIDDQYPPITFQFLNLKDFGLSDELYIKMNARGKVLTDFENFKSIFIQYLDKGNQIKLDKEWLDIFWKIKKEEEKPEDVEKKLYIFFKNITLNFYAESNKVSSEDIDNFDLFRKYKEVYKKFEKCEDKNYVNKIISVLEGLGSLISDSDACEIFKNFLAEKLNYWERVRFHSLCCFIIKHKQLGDENLVAFKRWLRVTHNLINNTLIQSPDNFQSAIRSLTKLGKHASDIYKFISDNKNSSEIMFFAKEQKVEESLKAKLILEAQDLEWENLIINIERHSYFDGQIGFILKYATNEEINKNEENNRQYDIQKFKKYSEILAILFQKDLVDNGEYLLQRALLTKSDYLPQIGNTTKYTFCNFDKSLRAKNENWRKVFNSTDKAAHLKELLDNLEPNQDAIKNKLARIIEDYQYQPERSVVPGKNKDQWRCYFIKEKECFKELSNLQIRKENDLIFLARSTANAWRRRAELFSYYYFIDNKKEFLPNEDLKLDYILNSESSFPFLWPSAVLRFSKSEFELRISYYEKYYRINLFRLNWAEGEIKDEVKGIIEKAGIKFCCGKDGKFHYLTLLKECNYGCNCVLYQSCAYETIEEVNSTVKQVVDSYKQHREYNRKA